MLAMVALVLAASLRAGGALPQLLPPAGDGDIRANYWEGLDQTQVWLTIEPKSPDGKPGPTAMNLTFGRTFSGKVPGGPAALFDVRASTGMMWAPRIELWFDADGGKVDLASGAGPGFQNGGGADYLAASIPVETLKRIAAASRITGNALGFAFELTPSQRQALRTFVARALSADPANPK